MARNYRMWNALLVENSARPITIHAITEVRLPKNHPMHGKVYKKVITNGFVNCNYEKAVRKVTQDPSFEAGPRPWGIHRWWVKDGQNRASALIEHKGKSYINYRELKRISTTYIDIEGREVDPSSFIDLLKKPEQPVLIRNYCLDNICEIHFGGKIIR